MPEGDTIHRTARRLAEVLNGKTLRGFRAARLAGARPRIGEEITAVEAQGKHLLIRFSGGLMLQTHLGMTGSWHVYEPNARWSMPEHLARVVIDVDGAVAVCFAAPVVRTASAASPTLAHLGIDLCRPDADIDAAVDRLDRFGRPDDEIGVVLLDQRIAAGIGNVYKSETLFACRVDPFVTLSALDRPVRRELLATAARLLQTNVERSSGRATTVGGGLAVYGRARRPCLACGTPIRSRPQGRDRRTTYFCPRCQRVSG